MATCRPSAKVLLIDADDRVLLFSGVDRTKPDAAPWWFPVGGGLEPGEPAVEGACREVREETGLVIDDPGPVVYTRRFSWEFEGAEYDQEEWFFLVRVDAFEPVRTGWTEAELETLVGHRWWTIGALRSTDETVFPEALADLLSRLVV